MGIWEKLFGKRQNPRAEEKLSPELRVPRTEEERQEILAELRQMDRDAERMQKDLEKINQNNEKELKELAILKQSMEPLRKEAELMQKRGEAERKRGEADLTRLQELRIKYQALKQDDPKYDERLEEIMQELRGIGRE